MKWQAYRLDSNVSKTIEDITLWKNEKGIMKIARDALAVKIFLDDQLRGYIFHGKGELLLDTIVETKKGAVGRPVERVVDEPFLLLGRLEEALQHLDDTEREDFTRLGYEEQQEFMSKATGLLDLFFERSTRVRKHSRTLSENGGLVFAFPNKTGKLDVLVAKRTKLIYKSVDRVFISKGEKAILKSHGNVVVSRPGKSVFIERNRRPTIHICKGDGE